MFETVELGVLTKLEGTELKTLTTKMLPKLAMIEGHPHGSRVSNVNLDKSTTIQLHFGEIYHNCVT